MQTSLKDSRVAEYGGFIPTRIQQIALNLIRKTKAKFILLYGGSRSGKTAIFVFLIFYRAQKYPESRHLMARFRFNHAKTSLWYDTLPKIAKVMGIKNELNWNKADWFIKFPNGSEVWIAGLDDKERLEKVLGNEYATIYINEASQTSYLAFTTLMSRLAQKIEGMKNLYLVDCNPPTKKHWIYQLFFLHRDPQEKTPVKKELYETMLMNPADNIENIASDYLELLDAMPERQKKRFKEGVFLDEIDGALFKQADIDKNRVDHAFDLFKTAVAIDPATSAKDSSDNTGIVVGGVAEGVSVTGKPENHAYILKDASGKYTPAEWGKKAIQLYYQYQCDCIVAESNQGGDMVRNVIHSIDPDIKVYLVHATKGKMRRAEPISNFYEQGRVHHVGMFFELEEELTTYTGDISEESPDRFDAAVWLLTHLMIGLKTNHGAGMSASGGEFAIPR